MRGAFAAHGIHLRSETPIASGNLTSLTEMAPPWPEGAQNVMVAGPKAKVSWGPRFKGEYDARFGNLDVRYGGTDQSFLAQVKAAVGELH